MAYSDKILDHYSNPRNIGTLDKSKSTVGTGLVGAPECGDVMRLQIEVENDIIIDAKFKTFGCVVSNTPINTINKTKKVSELEVGEELIAWNGTMVVSNKIKSINKYSVLIDDLLVFTFQRETSRKGINPLPFKLIVTKDHIFWNKNGKPIEAIDLISGDELFEITENELRKITNIRHNPQFRQKLRVRAILHNKLLDHSKLPQNTKGYVHGDAFRKKIKEASEKMWKNEDYIKKWTLGMSKIDWSDPTSIEKKFIKLFSEYNIPVKYSANKVWIQTQYGPKSPDFIVPGKKKAIEVYTSKMPLCMEDRSEKSGWVEKKKKQYESAGYEVLCLDVEKITECLSELQSYVHNGMKVLSVEKIKHKNELRGCERSDDGKVIVYDISLEDGANVFFLGRVGTHNCGSAIASSSLATEWLKGRTLAEALTIDNMDIVEELALPPVKIHCSVLAEDAIKSAIEDYRQKNNLPW
jgi:NifU-like protein involved in Fe-S cluster formation/mRNA-degrading endonuclease HigB of HigAB toxin-antitoxin module